MKAFLYTFEEGFKNGLRRFLYYPRNKQTLVECHNAMPSDSGLEPHEVVTSLNADAIDWGGEGKLAVYSPTRTITIDISDYVDGSIVDGASVFVGGVLKGTTDENGEISIVDIAVGVHTLLLTKTGYVDSDDDTLLNDYLVVT